MTFLLPLPIVGEGWGEGALGYPGLDPRPGTQCLSISLLCKEGQGEVEVLVVAASLPMPHGALLPLPTVGEGRVRGRKVELWWARPFPRTCGDKPRFSFFKKYENWIYYFQFS